MALLDEVRELVVKGHINIQSKYPPELAQKPGVEEKVKAVKEPGKIIGPSDCATIIGSIRITITTLPEVSQG